jgi:tetratricopeptide (TPR) repeat protein
MRSLTALVLYVSLAAASPASDWHVLHKQGVDAIKRRDFAAAAELFRDSASLAENPVQRALTANDLGVTLHQLHRDPEARLQLENAFRLWQANPGQEIRLAETTEALATVYRTLGDYPSAEQALREAMKTPPAESNSRALMLNELGDILREVGRPTEAHQLLETAANLPGISIRRRLDATLGLADLDRDARLWDSAFARWNIALATAREQHWPALEAASLRGLGTTYLEHGEFARAEPLLRRALAAFEASDAPLHQLSSTLSCLAQLYLAENKLALAEDALNRGMVLAEKSLGPQHPQVAVLLEMLGDTVANRNQFALSRDYYQRARLIMAGRFGEQSPVAAAVEASWALVEQRLKHNAEAAADYEKALAILDAAGPEVEPIRLNVHLHYAEVCKALHRKNPASAQSFRTLTAGGQMPQSH